MRANHWFTAAAAIPLFLALTLPGPARPSQSFPLEKAEEPPNAGQFWGHRPGEPLGWAGMNWFLNAVVGWYVFALPMWPGHHMKLVKAQAAYLALSASLLRGSGGSVARALDSRGSS